MMLSPAQKQARADSLFRIQQQEIIEMEAELLRDRMSIEVKEKTDSILAGRVRNFAQLPVSLPVTDSTKHSDTLAVPKDTLKPAP
ncbi:MAG: hypothetical protein JNL13_09865 [Chitinophagaceae bacterium]|nr:hypothetical protein [Chitinophagaceae bacterium]